MKKDDNRMDERRMPKPTNSMGRMRRRPVAVVRVVGDASRFVALCLALLAGASTMTMTRAVTVRPRRCHGAPKHIHLAPGKDASREMTVSYATMWAQPGIVAPVGAIRIGTDPHRLHRIVQEQELPLTYGSTQPQKRWGYYYAPYQHHFTIDDLEPDTTYYYQIESNLRTDVHAGALRGTHASIYDESELMAGHLQDEQEEEQDEDKSDDRRERERRRLDRKVYDPSGIPCPDPYKVRSFRTAPDSTFDESVTFAMVGDLGQFEHSRHTVASLVDKRHEYDAVVLVGDVAYTEYDHRRWDTFFDMFDDYALFDEKSLAVAVGNHDIEKQATEAELFQSYEARFRMPRVQPPQIGKYSGPKPDERLNMDAPEYPLPYEYGNSYYSFVYGPAIHIVLNAYSAMEPNSTQYQWFDETLKSVDRSKTPWVLVTIHTPIYNTYALHKHDKQIFAARDYIEPLCVERGVNMIFTGHIHAYQRTDHVAGGKVDPTGPVHVTIGAGGRKCDAPFKTLEPEDWVVARDASFYGYGMFHIFNHTHAEWRWVPLDHEDKHDGLNYVKNGDIDLPSLRHDVAIIQNTHYA